MLESEIINPFTAPTCKISRLKDAQCTCRQYIFSSYKQSTFNSVHFDENPCNCWFKKKKN